jgi:hypothetical protein
MRHAALIELLRIDRRDGDWRRLQVFLAELRADDDFFESRRLCSPAVAGLCLLVRAGGSRPQTKGQGSNFDSKRPPLRPIDYVTNSVRQQVRSAQRGPGGGRRLLPTV